MDNGADVNYPDSHKQTPLHLCLENYYDKEDWMRDVFDLLIERGADPNLKNYEGDSCLSLASLYINHDPEAISIMEKLRK